MRSPITVDHVVNVVPQLEDHDKPPHSVIVQQPDNGTTTPECKPNECAVVDSAETAKLRNVVAQLEVGGDGGGGTYSAIVNVCVQKSDAVEFVLVAMQQQLAVSIAKDAAENPPTTI
jgi:hypothetical protein